MLYLQIASPKSSVLNFLDSNSFEVIISIFQRTEKVPDMERLRLFFDHYLLLFVYFLNKPILMFLNSKCPNLPHIQLLTYIQYKNFILPKKSNLHTRPLKQQQ